MNIHLSCFIFISVVDCTIDTRSNEVQADSPIKCVQFKENCDPLEPDCSTKQVTCESSRSTCFLLVRWKVGSNHSTYEISQQGCWDKHKSCTQECVINSRNKNMAFCCCTKDMCNSNSTWGNFTKDGKVSTGIYSR